MDALCLVSIGKEWFAFTHSNNYLIVCGSSNNVTIQDQTIIPDSKHSKVGLETMESSDLFTFKYSSPAPFH